MVWLSVELLPAASRSQSGGRSTAHLDEIVGGAVGVTDLGFGEGPDKTSSSGTDSIVDSN